MELEFYRNFLTVVEKGNLTAAAEEIKIARSALGTQMINLEEEYGAKLLITNRGVKTVQLTEEGKIFYERVKTICSMEQNLHQEINNQKHGYKGELKITVSPALCEGLIEKEIKEFREFFPGISVILEEAAIVQQEMSLMNDDMEFGIANSPLKNPDKFEILDEKKLQYYVIAKPDNDWLDTTKAYITVEELADVPLCLTKSSAPVVISLMGNRNTTIKKSSMCILRSSTLTCVKEDYGVAVYPTTYEEQALHRDLVYVPLKADDIFAKQIVYKVKDKKLDICSC